MRIKQGVTSFGDRLRTAFSRKIIIGKTFSVLLGRFYKFLYDMRIVHIGQPYSVCAFNLRVYRKQKIYTFRCVDPKITAVFIAYIADYFYDMGLTLYKRHIFFFVQLIIRID